MISLRPCILALAALAILASLPTRTLAASSAVASASDGVSLSSDALGHSSRRSSQSSARTVAQGDYRVTQVAAAETGQQWVTLQRTDDPATELRLRLADAVVAAGGLVAGQVVTARDRPYGVELARADTRTAFFLLVDDDWAGDLATVRLGT